VLSRGSLCGRRARAFEASGALRVVHMRLTPAVTILRRGRTERRQ
jgi:hypothetical protein